MRSFHQSDTLANPRCKQQVLWRSNEMDKSGGEGVLWIGMVARTSLLVRTLLCGGKEDSIGNNKIGKLGL